MMSAVKRYGHISYLVEASPQILKLYPDMTIYVMAADFDRVTVERDALQQRLNAADQRIDELAAAEQRNAELVEVLSYVHDVYLSHLTAATRQAIRAALKPTAETESHE